MVVENRLVMSGVSLDVLELMLDAFQLRTDLVFNTFQLVHDRIEPPVDGLESVVDRLKPRVHPLFECAEVGLVGFLAKPAIDVRLQLRNGHTRAGAHLTIVVPAKTMPSARRK